MTSQWLRASTLELADATRRGDLAWQVWANAPDAYCVEFDDGSGVGIQIAPNSKWAYLRRWESPDGPTQTDGESLDFPGPLRTLFIVARDEHERRHHGHDPRLPLQS